MLVSSIFTRVYTLTFKTSIYQSIYKKVVSERYSLPCLVNCLNIK